MCRKHALKSSDIENAFPFHLRIWFISVKILSHYECITTSLDLSLGQVVDSDASVPLGLGDLQVYPV